MPNGVYRPEDTVHADGFYMKLVKEAGLFGKAYFGHKATKSERRKLNSFWKRAMKLAGDRVVVEKE